MTYQAMEMGNACLKPPSLPNVSDPHVGHDNIPDKENQSSWGPCTD